MEQQDFKSSIDGDILSVPVDQHSLLTPQPPQYKTPAQDQDDSTPTPKQPRADLLDTDVRYAAYAGRVARVIKTSSKVARMGRFAKMAKAAKHTGKVAKFGAKVGGKVIKHSSKVARYSPKAIKQSSQVTAHVSQVTKNAKQIMGNKTSQLILAAPDATESLNRPNSILQSKYFLGACAFISWGYIAIDTVNEAHKRWNQTQEPLEAVRTFTERLSFNLIASHFLPSFALTAAVSNSTKAFGHLKLAPNHPVLKYGPVAVGLISVPLLPLFIDEPAQEGCEYLWDTFWPSNYERLRSNDDDDDEDEAGQEERRVRDQGSELSKPPRTSFIKASHNRFDNMFELVRQRRNQSRLGQGDGSLSEHSVQFNDHNAEYGTTTRDFEPNHLANTANLVHHQSEDHINLGQAAV